ncbi:hypothetical protein QAD02_009642 [Eretmocerus hayati]|uniref:Uncharacterized protein n=1 Tax=Eretmocerus hayati TaxID=131215 RepID=A0ACC2NAA4_9HYME|nr:hypothetical protein QAD02_009642 [Eretmocerus hayati]
MHADVVGLLRDLVAFLERLSDLELPEAMQTGRDELLKRSKDVLESSTHTMSDSPEPYLYMSRGRTSSSYNNSIFSTGTTLADVNDVDDETDKPQEYVSPDNQRQLMQRGSLHYYETFQDFKEEKGKENGKTDAEKEIDDLVMLYVSFSAAQAKEKSVKCGTLLHLRRERKMFAPFNVFWLNRRCWASLVGNHLLLYANERESRPMLVIGLRGYSSRAAPDTMGKETRRGESAFELYCPGDRTFQFVAKNNQEMREWLQAFKHRSNSDENNGSEGSRKPRSLSEILELESNERMCIERVRQEKISRERELVMQQKEMTKREAGGSPKSKSSSKSKDTKDTKGSKQNYNQDQSSKSSTSEKEKLDEISSITSSSTTTTKEDAPPLPARRGRLPSLPSQERVSYEPREELYDEEGLYHRIEDIRAQQQEKQRQREYQNCPLGKPLEASRTKTTVDLLQETYDDVETCVNNVRDKLTEVVEPLETYDDVHSIQTKDVSNADFASHDDVQVSSETSRSSCTPTKETKIKSPKHSSCKATTPKRSFLDRVRSLKDVTTKKDEKKASIGKSSTPPPSTPITKSETPELPSYDDVSILSESQRKQRDQQQKQQEEVHEEEEYLTPPPPRPIYSRPPTIIKCATPIVPVDEIYDDIGSGPQPELNGCKGCANVDVIKNYPKNGSFLSDLQLSIEREHYQVPRSNRPATAPPNPPNSTPPNRDELYDDVALSETFKTRPRDPVIASSVWSRIGGAAAKSVPRIFDRSTSQIDEDTSNNVNRNNIDSNENDGAGVLSGSASAKVKPLHNLITKMESSLGKGSPVKIVGNN